MALPADGQPISLSQVQAEFGGAHPISMSEYYREGAYMTGNNDGVPVDTGDTTITMDDFHGTIKAITVLFEIIGGGGGGGWGRADGSYGNGTYAESGYTTQITHTDAIAFDHTVQGGAGGGNANRSYSSSSGYGTAGASSFYGSGGSRGSPNSHGGSALNSSYGAGGGGAGGDKHAWNDSSGNAGSGGSAGIRATYSKLLAPGQTVTVKVGRGGLGGNSTYDGGKGSGGYVKVTAGNQVSEYFNSNHSGTHVTSTYTVPS